MIWALNELTHSRPLIHSTLNHDTIKWTLFGSLSPKPMHTIVFVTPTKVSNHANMVRSGFYTWASSEERKGDVGEGSSTSNLSQQRDHPWEE